MIWLVFIVERDIAIPLILGVSENFQIHKRFWIPAFAGRSPEFLSVFSLA
jgi:hypothetical protein